MKMMTRLVPVKDIAISQVTVSNDFINALKELGGFAKIPTLKAVKFEGGRTKYEVMQGAEEVEAARQLGLEWESIQAVTIGDFERSTGSGHQYFTEAEREQEIEAAQRLLNLTEATPKPIPLIVAPAPVKKLESIQSDTVAFRTAYDATRNGRETVRIHKMRDYLGWNTERFNTALAKLRADYMIDVHLGDTKQLSSNEVKNSYIDPHGMLYLGISYRDEPARKVVETQVSQAEVPTTKLGQVDAMIAKYRANPMQFNRTERASIEKLIKMRS